MFDTSVVAFAHTHGSYDPDCFTEFFSFGDEDTDLGNAQKSNLISYVATPGGKSFKYTPTGDYNWKSIGIIEKIDIQNIPSDIKAGKNRINNFDSRHSQPNKYIVRPRI